MNSLIDLGKHVLIITAFLVAFAFIKSFFGFEAAVVGTLAMLFARGRQA